MAWNFSLAGPENDVLLRNLFEHYMYDMAEWFAIDTLADGSYAYDTSRLWRPDRQVYVMRAGESIAGFAIAGPATEWVGDERVRDVHEFFVLRRYRRQGAGLAMAGMLWQQHPGEWLVRALAANMAARTFWRAAIAQSAPQFHEELRSWNGREWRFFRFMVGA